MNSKVSKYLIRIVLILLGLSVIGVTLFLFLYVFWKGKRHEPCSVWHSSNFD